MCGTPVLETERFILRPLQRGDAEALFPSFSDDAQMRWWSRGPFSSVEELADWLCDPAWNGRTWVAVPKSGGDAIARFAATPRDSGMSEMAYFVSAPWQGRGVARECLTAVLDQLFVREGQRRVFADVDPDNTSSNTLLQRLGFTLEGRLRHQWHTHIGVRDSLIWGLLSEEWQQRR